MQKLIAVVQCSTPLYLKGLTLRLRELPGLMRHLNIYGFVSRQHTISVLGNTQLAVKFVFTLTTFS